MVDKKNVRQTILQLRQQLSPEYREESSHAICERLVQLAPFAEAQTILFYIAFRNEVDVQLAINVAWQQRKRVVLPRVNPQDRSMKCLQINNMDELQPGAYGILEPPDLPERQVTKEEIQLVIVPGVAFDRQGHRLGYGAGYYDRFFAGTETTLCRVGVAYTEQLVSHVYPEPHDHPMNIIVTPSETIML